MGLLNKLGNAVVRAARVGGVFTNAARAPRGTVGLMAVRNYPARYGDLHENCAHALRTEKLDKHAFESWQDVANLAAKNRSFNAVARAVTLGRKHGEHIIVPKVTSYESKGLKGHFDDDVKNVSPREKQIVHEGQDVYRRIQQTVAEKNLRKWGFYSWESLAKYAEKIDDHQLEREIRSIIAGLEHQQKVAGIQNDPKLNQPAYWETLYDKPTPLPDQNGNTVELEDIVAKPEFTREQIEAAVDRSIKNGIKYEEVNLADVFAEMAKRDAKAQELNKDQALNISMKADFIDDGLVKVDSESWSQYAARWMNAYKKAFPSSDIAERKAAYRISQNQGTDVL